MSFFTIKPVPSVKELKILLLKISFGVLFVVFGIFGVFSDTFAFTNDWKINFESGEGYNLGELSGQQGWSGTAAKWIITDDSAYVESGTQGVRHTGTDAPYYELTKTITDFDTDTTGIYYWRTNLLMGDGVQGHMEVRQKSSAGGELGLFVWRNTAGKFKLGVAKAHRYNCDTGVYLGWADSLTITGELDNEIWIEAGFEMNADTKLIKAFYTYQGNFSYYEDACFWYNSTKQNLVLDRLVLKGRYNNFGAIDNLNITGVCSATSCTACEDWFDCQYYGCCWVYNPWYPPPFDQYCDFCEGECSYPLNCGLCEAETTCETAGCFWTGDYCTQFEWSCGGELACQFCDSQETCEAEGCNWNEPTGTCWYAAPTLPSTWSEYYDLHGGYEVPADFVDQLAETTGATFIVVSGLFEGFLASFNTADALAKGSALGNVIPKGRGYLKVFDGLFGHYPIGETFVFILIFMLAVGLFRIARQLIQLVKP